MPRVAARGVLSAVLLRTLLRAVTLPCAIALLCAVAACGVDRDADPRYVRIAISSNPQSLDPALATDVNGGDVCAKLFNGLVTFDGLAVRPDLAETWTVSADGTKYLFTLKKNVRFHNGRALTAADIDYSFRRLLDPATSSKRAWVLDAVDTFRALGADRFEMTLKHPSAPFLSLLAMPACYAVPREEVERLGDRFGRSPCGSGPWRFERWEDDRAVALLRNDDYFETPPRAAGIIYRIIPEPLTQVALLKQGSLDICEIPEMQLPVMLADPAWKERIQSCDQLVTVYVAINNDRYSDARVRRAFNMAIDVDRIIAATRSGMATRARGPVPPLLMPGVADAPLFDPAEARRLLVAANFDFSKQLFLLRSSARGALESAEAVAGYLRDIGVRVRIEPMEFSAMRARANKGDFDLCLLNWYADYADAENFLAPLFHSKNVGSAGNRSRFSNAAADALMDSVTALGPGVRRNQAVMDAVALLAHEAPWIYLWHPKFAVAVAPRIVGYTAPAIFNGEKGERFEIRNEE